MESYLVGGAVRDKLMGVHSNDNDYVVVGATPDRMIELGYSKVGKDFPVFLHPNTGEEYALARREHSTGSGEDDFIISWENVSLNEDLMRRDLTINAMAIDAYNNLIDPYGGYEDLQSKTLRAVSNAFMEDPVRVLRVAMFAARYYEHGFTVADQTMLLMKDMVSRGMLDHLTTERVFLELRKVLGYEKPSVFFNVLNDCGALEVVFPEIHALIGQSQPEEHHPEGDSYIHTMLVVDEMANNYFVSFDPLACMYSALVHDLGKGLTKKEDLPRHIDHETKAVD